VIENPQLEHGIYLEYRAGDATRELEIYEIVSLSIEAEPTIFDGKVFYPATLSLEDSVAIPNKRGFVCVEGTLIAGSAGKNLTIPLANIKELKRQEKK